MKGSNLRKDKEQEAKEQDTHKFFDWEKLAVLFLFFPCIVSHSR